MRDDTAERIANALEELVKIQKGALIDQYCTSLIRDNTNKEKLHDNLLSFLAGLGIKQ